jgi:CRP-like cAMP-binding protein
MEKIKNRLKKISFLQGLLGNERSFDKLADIIKTKKFKEETAIVQEGTRDDTLYILNKGIIKIEKKTLHGEPYTICIIGEQDNAFFGEQGILENAVRSATVIAQTNCECFTIKKNDFEKFCSQNPKEGMLIIKDIALILSQRLRKASQDNITLFGALVEEIGKD